MTKIPFEAYKNTLIEDIQKTTDFKSLEERILDAQLEIDSKEECETNEDVLVKILKFSHKQVMSGRSFSQEEAERFLDQRLYEFKDKMVGTRVAESFTRLLMTPSSSNTSKTLISQTKPCWTGWDM